MAKELQELGTELLKDRSKMPIPLPIQCLFFFDPGRKSLRGLHSEGADSKCEWRHWPHD